MTVDLAKKGMFNMTKRQGYSEILKKNDWKVAGNSIY